MEKGDLSLDAEEEAEGFFGMEMSVTEDGNKKKREGPARPNGRGMILEGELGRSSTLAEQKTEGGRNFAGSLGVNGCLRCCIRCGA